MKQSIYTFTNGARFVVKDNSDQVWNGCQYVSKDTARRQFRTLLKAGYTYETHESQVCDNAPLRVETMKMGWQTMWGHN